MFYVSVYGMLFIYVNDYEGIYVEEDVVGRVCLCLCWFCPTQSESLSLISF